MQQEPRSQDAAPACFEPLPEEGFQFACHPSVACFNVCCRDLHLVLTPYDVLRLKRALGLESGRFLEEYTIPEADPHWGIPVVKMRMLDREDRPCPFVRPEGCSVYPDRPAACRTYPLGRAARQALGSEGPQKEERYFLVREPHCLGFQENKRWSLAGWLSDQGLAEYNAWTDRWMAFLSRYRPGAGRDLLDAHWKMFYMACYSLDRFREFVFGTRLLLLVDVPDERVQRMRTSDEELLSFALDWLGFSVFGAPLFSLRGRSVHNARP
jgi:Fe-S-cluster containining protein